MRVQYWHRHWDGKADPIVRYSPAGSGWAPLDDWTNGQWKDADAELSIAGRDATFSLAPSGAKEFPDLGSPGVSYRKTLKVRVVADVPLPKIARFQVLTISELRPLTVRILWGQPACAELKTAAPDPCRLEVFNGLCAAIRAAAGGNFTVAADGTWTLPADCAGRYRGRSSGSRSARRRYKRCHRRHRPLEVPAVFVFGRRPRRGRTDPRR